MADTFDLTVIGTGPGGYVCAIRAAQLGMKVAVVEKWPSFGGTCLNIGCIPSKALLHASEMFEEAGHTFPQLGIEVGAPKLNLPAMMAHKDDTVASNTGGIEYLFKKNKITAFKGTGKIAAQGKVTVTAEDGSATEIETKNIVIATGSVSANLPGIEIDEEKIVTSTGALKLDKVPDNLLVIGAGVIGLELGSVWARLGAKVTVVEFLDRILPGMDLDVAKQFQRMLSKQGFDFKLGTKVTGIEKTESGLVATLEPTAGGEATTLETDIALVSIGRIPFTDGLGLDDLGIERDKRGRVVTNGHYKTNLDGIYAIGDVIAGPMLAHKAEDEGIAIAEILAGQAGHVNYSVIPGVVYTNPEVASVGKTEEDLKAEGIAYKAAKFPFTANGRAKAMLAPQGFVKILADKETDRVLGCHIVGKGAGEMIHEAAVLMEFGGSSEDLARTCHAHPTMSEAVREAALGLGDGSIHI
ncbi:dihydrolipoyl dehydrogenase [Pelagibacterium halotolerans]|uniref:Dihydrolipoyl dehydrogenase n=1 Tax=Pelagibacterium halotolerans (strain DSM 22347 / JCM 15775 / CGMCC 1.7692 / B2) TaxID=1082931 RepID=G4R6B0_PELHB|nr:dihydrolipoyl dehydrogenase [Pelagibacterium halotolerans]AEQ53175.1 dihydrolipoamide dehydrogenase of 2-oxoglutarate dehydrogenase [Pelagibacterium halotolerans B2]QJR17185.1 dihydrolipoyl dehydrogenase [Pelagibacterium halotolerans]SEA89534.1 dihydrolipoamide dehydrogenase [Pelagibacterium halotolerans]